MITSTTSESEAVSGMRRKHSLLDFWRGWLDSLDTGGGHIFVLCAVVLFGMWMFFRDNTAGGQMINLSVGALLAKLTAKKSNREQMSASATTTTQTTQTPPPPDPPPPPPAAVTLPTEEHHP